MIKAFGYLRVSGASQLEGDGFARQRASIEAYAAAHGYEITRWFEEEGVSGKTQWGDRPAWVDMMLAVNGTKTIFVEKLDRVARDLMIQEHIIADLRRRQLDLISVAEPDLCIDDPSRKLLRQIMGAIHEYERSQITAKLRAAKTRLKAQGKKSVEGRKPYGTHSGERETLEWMRKSREEGATFEAIAAALNGVGTFTRYGKPWVAASICKILKRD